MAMIHFLCGSTGAGKTTYALRLAEELGAVRFSIDEWMSSLFWMDAPQPIDPAWAMARIERCNMVIWRTAADVARCGTDCLLEVGLTTREARARFAALAGEARLPFQFHFVDVPAEERWRRVEARNRQPGTSAQLTFAVTREMFDFVESLWEPPTAEEMAAYNGVVVAG